MAEIYSRFGIFIILVIAVIVASFLSDAFFTTRNLSNIIRQNAVIMIIAFGSQMVLITGGCDLSPGSVCALSDCYFHNGHGIYRKSCDLACGWYFNRCVLRIYQWSGHYILAGSRILS